MERCQFHPDKIGIDKSALKLKNSLQNIQAHLIYQVSFLLYNKAIKYLIYKK